MTKLSSILPIHCSSKHSGIGHVFFSLCERWQGQNLATRMVIPSCGFDVKKAPVVEAVPKLLRGICYKKPGLPEQLTEQRFLRDLKDFDAAYLWPGVSLQTFERTKAYGKPIFLERVNCFTGFAKQILDAAYENLGLVPAHPITPSMVQDELAEVALADFILCPSVAVTNSFRMAGVPARKLITTSEGWDPQRFPQIQPKSQQSDEFTVLLLGSDSIRKGVPLLLRAWDKAKIKGRLILMGRMAPAIAQLYGDILSRPDVTHIEFSLDYTAMYQQADVFALPSLEEGSPLVVYEAMAHRLPILASPMGAGGVVRDGVEGMVIAPDAEDQWVEALRTLAANPDLRSQLGSAARQQALEYTWDKVAARRAELMLSGLQQNVVYYPTPSILTTAA